MLRTQMRGSSAPEAPASVTATDGSYNAYIRVSWPAVLGATKYAVWRSASPDASTAIRIADGLIQPSYKMLISGFCLAT